MSDILISFQKNWHQLLSKAASFIVMLVGITVFAGWLFDIPTLKSIYPNWVSMKANTALAFFSLGLSLWLQYSKTRLEFTRNLSNFLAGFTILLSFVTLMQYLLKQNFGIDELLFKDPYSVVISYPGRMAPNTTVSFILLGLALILVNARSFVLRTLTPFLVILSALIALLVFINYAYSNLFSLQWNPMALHTAITFLILCGGVFEVWRIKNASQTSENFDLKEVPLQDTPLEKMIALTFAIGLLTLVVVGILSGRSIGKLVESEGWVKHTHEVISEIDNLLIDLLNAETGQRGYILKTEEIYLKTYRLGESQVAKDITTLETLIRDNPRQERRLELLKPVVLEKINGMRSRIKSREEMGLAEAAAQMGDGRENMEKIRRILNEMKGEEERLLGERRLESESTARVTVLAISYGSLFAFLLVGLASFFINRDILKRKKIDERLRRRNAEVQAVNKELEAFSYSVSHDLRAPLRHIDGFVDLLQKEANPTLSEKSRHYLAIISDSAKQMGCLIDDLLVFSKMGRTEMRQTRISVKEMVESVIREILIENKQRKIKWEIRFLPEVQADPPMLRLVLVNLIANAIKYTGTQEQAVIEIGSINDKKDETVFFVKDNGVGFDMKYVDKLFGVFQRLHTHEEFEGTGIGLANVRRIILRHGGKTWAESAQTGGATFYFSLPK